MKFSRDQKLFIVELVNTIDKIHLSKIDFQMGARLTEDKKDIILETEASYSSSKYTDSVEIEDDFDPSLGSLKNQLKAIHKKCLALKE